MESKEGGWICPADFPVRLKWWQTQLGFDPRGWAGGSQVNHHIHLLHSSYSSVQLCKKRKYPTFSRCCSKDATHNRNPVVMKKLLNSNSYMEQYESHKLGIQPWYPMPSNMTWTCTILLRYGNKGLNCQTCWPPTKKCWVFGIYWFLQEYMLT